MVVTGLAIKPPVRGLRGFTRTGSLPSEPALRGIPAPPLNAPAEEKIVHRPLGNIVNIH